METDLDRGNKLEKNLTLLATNLIDDLVALYSIQTKNSTCEIDNYEHIKNTPSSLFLIENFLRYF